jgi:hypothetical protein
MTEKQARKARRRADTQRGMATGARETGLRAKRPKAGAQRREGRHIARAALEAFYQEAQEGLEAEARQLRALQAEATQMDLSQAQQAQGWPQGGRYHG